MTVCATSWPALSTPDFIKNIPTSFMLKMIVNPTFTGELTYQRSAILFYSCAYVSFGGSWECRFCRAVLGKLVSCGGYWKTHIQNLLRRTWAKCTSWSCILWVVSSSSKSCSRIRLLMTGNCATYFQQNCPHQFVKSSFEQCPA